MKAYSLRKSNLLYGKTYNNFHLFSFSRIRVFPLMLIFFTLKAETEKQKSFDFIICFVDLMFIFLPAPAITIKPKKCISLRELQTTNRMPTVCKPSISHSSLKNTSMMPTHDKRFSCLHPRLPTCHRPPRSKPHTLSLFVELQRHVSPNIFMFYFRSQILPFRCNLCGGFQN